MRLTISSSPSCEAATHTDPMYEKLAFMYPNSSSRTCFAPTRLENNHTEIFNAVWNCFGTRSNGAWIAPGFPSWPQAAIWSSPRLGRKKTVHPASAKTFRNSIIFASLVGWNWDPVWGLNEIRLILHGMPSIRSISLFASSMLQIKIQRLNQWIEF